MFLNFITENHGFVKHNFDRNIEPDDLIFENIGEIILEFLWIDDFDISICIFCQLSNDLHFSTFTLYSDHIDNDVLLFGDLTQLFVVGLGSFIERI